MTDFNLKTINRTLEYNYFKMDTIGLVAHLIQQNYYILKIDLKDAYYSLKLLDEHTKYLCVTKWIGFRAKEINKIHKTPYSCLKIGGNHIAIYIDGLIIAGETYGKCLAGSIKTIKIFLRLGFLIHPDKSSFCKHKK